MGKSWCSSKVKESFVPESSCVKIYSVTVVSTGKLQFVFHVVAIIIIKK